MENSNDSWANRNPILVIALLVFGIMIVGGWHFGKKHFVKLDALRNLQKGAQKLQKQIKVINPKIQKLKNEIQVNNPDFKQLGENVRERLANLSSQGNCPMLDDYDDFDYKSMHMYNDGTSEPTKLCSQDPLPGTCGGPGTTIYGMTVTNQDIYPGSYLPAAVYNTSGYSQSCAEMQPDQCYE